jgi:hypothetical protein
MGINTMLDPLVPNGLDHVMFGVDPEHQLLRQILGILGMQGMVRMMSIKNINLYVYTLQCMHAISSISMYYVVNISIMVSYIPTSLYYPVWRPRRADIGVIPGIEGSEGVPRMASIPEISIIPSSRGSRGSRGSWESWG